MKYSLGVGGGEAGAGVVMIGDRLFVGQSFYQLHPRCYRAVF